MHIIIYVFEQLTIYIYTCYSGPPVLTVHMTSDNDGEFVVGSSGCPSPMPGANTGRGTVTAVNSTAAKGILVHKNKKSVNTNRVSFVTNSSTIVCSSSSKSPSPVPSPSVKRPKNKHHQQQRSDDENDDVQQLPYHARTGRRLTGFGVKSYLHEFYDHPNDHESLQVCVYVYTYLSWA